MVQLDLGCDFDFEHPEVLCCVLEQDTLFSA